MQLSKLLEMQKMTLDPLSPFSRRRMSSTNTLSRGSPRCYPEVLYDTLPTVPRRRDAILNPFSHQFRFCFPCEFCTHTTREGSKEMDKVHLADHPGYDIERQTEFFRKYAPYILAVIRAIQLGARVVSIDLHRHHPLPTVCYIHISIRTQ